LRWRWGSREDDPGALQRPFRPDGGLGNGQRPREIVADAKRAFLARDVALDCIHPRCKGKFLTSLRKFGNNGGMGSRVVLRCTRRPDHELVISIRPYTTGEHDELRDLHRRGERLQCARCGTALQPGSRSRAKWFPSGADEGTYHCPWCGVKWEMPNVSSCRV
jgi:hypothetical protein